MVTGWQSMLGKLLDQLSPYLQPSRIVTFRQLTSPEMQIFQEITEKVEVSDAAWGIYLPPSARNQMLYINQGHEIPESAIKPKDNGVLLLSRISSRITILNVLLAHPPYTPAIDVYENGALLAGYVYDSIDECLASITQVISIYLGNHKPNAVEGSLPGRPVK